MSILELLRNEKLEDREDGVSIRNLKEQNNYLKSTEYQRLLNDLEELKAKRETREQRRKQSVRIYNSRRYKLEKTLYELKYKMNDEPIKPIRDLVIKRPNIQKWIFKLIKGEFVRIYENE